MDPVALLATACAVLSAALIWPQVWRVYRLDTVEGLAPLGTLHGLSGCVLWTVYGVAQRIAPMIVSNVAIMAAMLLIAVALIRHRRLRVAPLVATLATAGAVGAIALGVSVSLAGWVAIVVGVTSILPQAVYACVTDDLSALSLPTYGLICANSSLWALYGSLIGDGLVVLPNLLILPCAAFIGLRAWRSQAALAVD